MQSTGQTSTQAVSFTPTQGSQMMWVMPNPRFQSSSGGTGLPAGPRKGSIIRSGIIDADGLDRHSGAIDLHLERPALARLRRRGGLVGEKVAGAELLLDAAVDSGERGGVAGPPAAAGDL